MRLKEPLYSLRALSGHIVMHSSLFIVSFQVSIENYYNHDPALAD